MGMVVSVVVFMAMTVAGVVFMWVIVIVMIV